MICPHCGSEQVIKNGLNKLKTKQCYNCKQCNKAFSVLLEGVVQEKKKSEKLLPHTKVNINRLKKTDILWLFNHRCKKHNMPYLEHPGCFAEEKPKDAPFTEKIGFLDIESSSLVASFGYIFSYCIKELDGTIYESCITPNDIRNGTFDKKILQKCVEDMRKFDRLVVYYGGDCRHDVPFLRTRCVYWGIDFPIFREMELLDLYPVIKRRFRFHRNRLETACDFFGIPSKEHKMNYDVWIRAMAGNKEALDYILVHNREDVFSTELLYKKVIAYSNVPKQSL
jgi:uncharacterized protein YprB with RNaseH-like and TPR domain